MTDPFVVLLFFPMEWTLTKAQWAWLIHCHNAPHQVMGMQALFMYGVRIFNPVFVLQSLLTLVARPSTFHLCLRAWSKSIPPLAAERTGSRPTTRPITFPRAISRRSRSISRL